MKTLYRINKEEYTTTLEDALNHINFSNVSCYNPLLVERIKLDWKKISIEELLNVRDTFWNLWYEKEDLENLEDLISHLYDKKIYIIYRRRNRRS